MEKHAVTTTIGGIKDINITINYNIWYPDEEYAGFHIRDMFGIMENLNIENNRLIEISYVEVDDGIDVGDYTKIYDTVSYMIKEFFAQEIVVYRIGTSCYKDECAFFEKCNNDNECKIKFIDSMINNVFLAEKSGFRTTQVINGFENSIAFVYQNKISEPIIKYLIRLELGLDKEE